MTQRLREELARLADDQSPLRVADDVWARGRAARRRDRLVVAVASLCLVAMVGGLGVVLSGGLGSREAQPADRGDDGAVPSRLFPVPQRFVQSGEFAGRWAAGVAETDLAVGRASVAFAVGEGDMLPVVVAAADGAYHPLVLPGWDGSFATVNLADGDGAALALSPDGRNLAYGWWDPSAPLDRPMPAGIRVVDLETGDLRTIALHGGNGVAPGQITWSPDSRWIVWCGAETKSWTPETFSYGRPVAGRIAPDETESEPLPQTRESNVALAISSRGVVSSVTQGGEWWRWDGRIVDRGRTASRNVALQAATSPDGTSVALGTTVPGPDAWFLDPATGRVAERPLAAGADLYPEGATVHPLGWIDDHTVVSMVFPAYDVEPDAGWSYADPHLALMTAPSRSSEHWTYRVVTRLTEDKEGGGQYDLARTVTVAVDLMTVDDPTESFPEPDWPWSTERKVVAVAGALAGTLALGYAAWYLLRRRRGVLLG